MINSHYWGFIIEPCSEDDYINLDKIAPDSSSIYAFRVVTEKSDYIIGYIQYLFRRQFIRFREDLFGTRFKCFRLKDAAAFEYNRLRMSVRSCPIYARVAPQCKYDVRAVRGVDPTVFTYLHDDDVLKDRLI